MAVTEISKIQLRRGLEAELQTGSLDAGEFGFALDSGRLFIGTDPSLTGPWTTRVLPPYDNVEVLTETSLATFARLFDRMHRTVGPIGLIEGSQTFGRRPYLDATLAPIGSWNAVLVKRIDQSTGLLDDDTTEELTLVEGTSCGAVIQYFLMDGDDVVRTGVLTIVHDGNPAVDEAQTFDENVSSPSVAAQGVPILVHDLFVTGVMFRAMRVSDGPGSYRIRLEYMNNTTKSYTVQLRAMVSALVNP